MLLYDFVVEKYLEIVSTIVVLAFAFLLYRFYSWLKEKNDLEALKRQKRIEDGFGTKD
jgi:hypothetical protein